MRLSGKPDALDKRSEALIRPQDVERGLDVEHAHLPIASLDRLLQPFERTLRIAEADVHVGDTNGRRIPRGRDTLQFVERRKRLSPASRPRKDVSHGGDDVGASTTHEAFAALELLSISIGGTPGALDASPTT